MERWTIGLAGVEKSIFVLKHYSIIPTFHDSRIILIR